MGLAIAIPGIHGRFARREPGLLTVVTGHSPTSAVQNALVSPGLDSVVAAVADLEDHELGALIAMVDDGPQIAPGLFAWIEHVCDWEQNRRQGRDFPLQPPEAAIEPSEDAVNIVVLTVLRATFGRDPDSASQAVSVLRATFGRGGFPFAIRSLPPRPRVCSPRQN